MSSRVEYRRIYLTALVAVMAGGDSTQHLPHSDTPEEPVLPECLDLLLGDLEDMRGGPEFLSLALFVASLLLSQCSDSRFLYMFCFYFRRHILPYNTSGCSSDFFCFCISVQGCPCPSAGVTFWKATDPQQPLKSSGLRVLKLCVWLEFL